MNAEAAAILQAAIALPAADRLQLVDALISTLEPEDAAPLDDALITEIDRRSREIDAGAVTLVPWEEVREQACRRAKSHA